MTQLRETVQVKRVLAELVKDPGRARYARELARAVDLAPATVSRILTRLEGGGLLDSEWSSDKYHQGHPPRRYYRLNDAGVARLATRHTQGGAA